MHPSAWAALLRHIPAEQHNQFMVVTAAGTEITIQSLLRVEDELVVIKGRLAGSQDAGRVFFLPFANIDYFGFLNPIKDEEYEAVFGTFAPPTPPTSAPAEVAALRPSAQGQVPTSAQGTHAARGSTFDRPAIRSEILDRFRSRGGQP